MGEPQGCLARAQVVAPGLCPPHHLPGTGYPSDGTLFLTGKVTQAATPSTPCAHSPFSNTLLAWDAGMGGPICSLGPGVPEAPKILSQIPLTPEPVAFSKGFAPRLPSAWVYFNLGC